MQSHRIVIKQAIANSDKSNLDDLMKVKLALTELEKAEPEDKQLIVYKCKLYPKVFNAVLECKDLTPEQLEYAHDMLNELSAIVAAKQIVDKYEPLLNRKLLALPIPGVSCHPAVLFKGGAGEASLKVLHEAKAELAETNEVAKSIIGNLHIQGKTIANAKGNISDVNKELGHSNRLLTKMSRWWRG